jgi:penicillin-binding protein-related factor A (putative recombinase)
VKPSHGPGKGQDMFMEKIFWSTLEGTLSMTIKGGKESYLMVSNRFKQMYQLDWDDSESVPKAELRSKCQSINIPYDSYTT